MDFIINLIRDYKKGYGIVIKKYKNFIPNFILASILIIVIAMLHAGLPYILRLIVTLFSIYQVIQGNLLPGAFIMIIGYIISLTSPFTSLKALIAYLPIHASLDIPHIALSSLH